MALGEVAIDFCGNGSSAALKLGIDTAPTLPDNAVDSRPTSLCGYPLCLCHRIESRREALYTHRRFVDGLSHVARPTERPHKHARNGCHGYCRQCGSTTPIATTPRRLKIFRIPVTPTALVRHTPTPNPLIVATEKVCHYHAQRIDVAATIDVVGALEQLRRSIPTCAAERPRQVVRRVGGIAEIDDFNVVIDARNEYIFGL